MKSAELNEEDRVSQIVSEFAETFAYSRARWARFAADAHPELSGVSMTIMHFVMRNDPATATDLSTFLNMDKSFVSRQVSKLRELGYLAASADKTDRRIQNLSITDQGMLLLREFRGNWVGSYRKIFAGWSEAELSSLYEGLQKFNAATNC